MRKFTAAIAAIAAVLLAGGLSSCSSAPPSSQPAPTVTVTNTPSAAPTQPVTSAADQAFIQTTNSDPILRQISPAKRIKAAHAVCNVLLKGATPVQVGGYLIKNGMSPSSAGVFVGAAIGAYCPQVKLTGGTNA